ncbi:hypothetical protein RJT34_11386 [Clitoria ternatea]|uniref:Protein kinase domain-containing protein n=1 Tax=Clitoria ternatea TaxID=43366 RepID=A0AAN9JJU5_CLITE
MNLVSHWLCSECSETDKLALLALKEKLTNGVPDSLPSWNHSLHFCEWQGVECGHRHIRVTGLHLQNQNWGGTLCPALGNLTFLRSLNLSNINLRDEIPRQIGRLKRLKFLDLSNNNLQGEVPIELTNCSNLEVLTLLYNKLTGKVPTWFGSMVQLTKLKLGANDLVGTIPPYLGNLSSLKLISLSRNHLKGNIPHSLGRLSNLKGLYLGSNSLSGIVPPSLYNLSNIQTFAIGENRLSGDNNFGSGKANDLDFLSSLSNCTELHTLWLDFNRFGGVLPDSIGNLSTHLSSLDMGSNQISGMIPEGIGQLIGLSDFILVDNFLEGTIPLSIGNLKNLVRLVLQQNKLSGNIPSVIGNLTVLSELYLHTNKLEGSIPFTLRYCTRMQSFGVALNNLSGDIPNQTFGHLKGLINLDLSTNSLTGSIPSEFGTLKHLSLLDLYENKFSGEIPLELGASSALTELALQRNFFHGNIPLSFGTLRSLEILDLSNNNFSGTIPRGVFSNVTKISLVGNKDLCGGIPQLKLPACTLPPLKKHKRSLQKKVIFITVFGGVLISVIGSISIYYLRKRPNKSSSSPSLQNRHLRVSYGELHEATNGFSSSNLVGAGSFGSVYKGSLLHFEEPIALKVLNLEKHGASRSFISECKALGKIKHRNLVKILTCCSSVDYKGEDFKAIVYEFMPNGSLESLLHSNDEELGSRNANLSFQHRLDIALDVANALDYLHHGSEQPIVHCDIKPSNVLLDDHFVAHLGDFGLARLLHGHWDIPAQIKLAYLQLKEPLDMFLQVKYLLSLTVLPALLN